MLAILREEEDEEANEERHEKERAAGQVRVSVTRLLAPTIRLSDKYSVCHHKWIPNDTEEFLLSIIGRFFVLFSVALRHRGALNDYR